MQGEYLTIREEHKKIASDLAELIRPDITKKKGRFIIAIAGESGSGKSSVAHEVCRIMNDHGIRTLLIQQDDYFRLPPGTNYDVRRKDISVVGMGEVDLVLLSRHVSDFRSGKKPAIRKPLVLFDENRIIMEDVDCSQAKALVVEGTYVTLLSYVDRKVFLEKDYKDNYPERVRRGRERIDGFDKDILEIEHKIIVKHRDMCDIVVRKNNTIRQKNKKVR